MKKMFILLMTILVAGIILGCQAPPPAKTPTPPPTTPTTVTEVTPTTPIVTTTPPVAQPASTTVNCSLCHRKAEDYSLHKDGSGCLKCHGTDPHAIHVGKGTINLECTVCHGPIENLTIPKGPDGQPSCVNCHDSVNPLDYFKNYVNVHLPRGKPCTVCHTEDIAEIHKKADEVT